MTHRLFMLLVFALIAGWGFVFGGVLLRNGFGWGDGVSLAGALGLVLNALEIFARCERRAERARIERIVQMVRGGGA